MTRSITGTPQSRGGTARLRAAVLLAVPAAALALLAGCGSGQLSQTASMQAAVGGAAADSADGVISLREVVIEYPGPEGYPAGATIPLGVRIVNNSPTEPVTLQGVDVAAGGGRVVLLGGAAATAPASTAPRAGSSASGPASASGSASASAASTASASASVPPSASASTSASGTPSAGPVASASAGPAGAPVRLTIQPNQLAALAKTAENPAYLAIIGRTEPLSVGGTVKLVFHFDKQRDVTVTAPVAVPLSPLPRASMTLPAEEH